MNGFKEIAPGELQENPVDLFGKQWALLTAADGGKANTMTIAWGTMGYLWNKPVVFVFVRPQRYTLPFMEKSGEFTLSFFDESWKDKLTYCGRTSGRDEDKIAKCGFTVHREGEAVCFEESRLTMVCRKLYAGDLRDTDFVDKDLMQKCYPDADYHRVFVGEIEKIYTK